MSTSECGRALKSLTITHDWMTHRLFSMHSQCVPIWFPLKDWKSPVHFASAHGLLTPHMWVLFGYFFLVIPIPLIMFMSSNLCRIYNFKTQKNKKKQNTIGCGVVNRFWRHSPIFLFLFKHVCLWCLFFDRHLTTHHSKYMCPFKISNSMPTHILYGAGDKR